MSIAFRRHATYYLTVLHTIDDLYEKDGNATAEALELFDQSWKQIEHGQNWAVANASDDPDAKLLCSEYPASGMHVLDLRLPPQKLVQWLQIALTAAQALKDREAEGSHLNHLGSVYRNLGDFNHALLYHRQALAIARQSNNQRAEAYRLGGLANTYLLMGNSKEALAYYQAALTTSRAIGDVRLAEACIGHIGSTYADLGEYAQAVEYLHQALESSIDRKDSQSQGRGSVI